MITLLLLLALQDSVYRPGQIFTVGSSAPPASCVLGAVYIKTSSTARIYVCTATNVWKSIAQNDEVTGGSLPSGMLLFATSGTCPAGTTEDTSFNGKTLVATTITAGNAGTTSGNDNVTPTGTNGTSVVTPLGSNSIPTIAWPGGVPTNSGIAVSDHASHTHTYTEVPNHLHPYASQTLTTGTASSYEHGTIDTSSTSIEASITTNNPTGGVSTGTTAGPSATLSHTISSQGTVAWPAGVPTNSASTFTGTSSVVSAQTFTGTQFDNRSAFIRVIVCKAN